MSCYWDLFCVDCDESYGFDDWNRGDKEVAWLWQYREVIAALVPMYDEAPGCIDFNFFSRFDGCRIDPRWFARHKDHDVRVRDEYGRFMGDPR